MDKLLKVADLQASQSYSATSAADFDEHLSQEFVLKNPVWDFHCVSRNLQRSKAEKEQALLKYYNQIKMGEQIHLFCLLLRNFTICFFYFSNCFDPNFPRSLIGV